METKTISIKGMHCKSCEILIEDELKKIKNIQKINISHQTGLAVIHYKGKINQNDLNNAVQNAGYTLGKNDALPFLSRNIQDYIDLGIAALIVIFLYFIAKESGIFSLNIIGQNNFKSLPVVFVVGLAAGISTCMALVGGLVLGVAGRFAQQHENATVSEKFVPHVFFNMGRIASFFVLGGLVGLIGSLFQLSSVGTGAFIILVGGIMAVLGLQLIGIFPRLTTISISLPKVISRLFGVSDKRDNAYSHINTMMLGGLTFFVPCGFTQAVQLYAMTTGSFLQGAMTMFIFALGTAPGLLSLGGATSFIKGKSGLLFRIVGVIVIGAAFFNVQNGLALVGIKTQASLQRNVNVTIENGVQVIRMEQTAQGYSPNSFTVKKGIPVKWIIKSIYPYSCASSFIVQKLNIRTLLTEKDQIFEFTPEESGEIPFSCSMGMYSGSITISE